VISFQYAPIFFQAVGRDEKEKGREDAGRTWDEMPIVSRRDVRAMAG